MVLHRAYAPLDRSCRDRRQRWRSVVGGCQTTSSRSLLLNRGSGASREALNSTMPASSRSRMKWSLLALADLMSALENIDRDTAQRFPNSRAIIAFARHHSVRSEEHTSELQSLMRISYAVFCLKKKNQNINRD